MKPTLALVAVLALAFAPPGFAADTVAPDAVVPLPELGQEPLEMAPKNQCKGAFSTFFYPFPMEDDCQAACTTYCTDNGGYLYSWSHDKRDPSCRCNCCRA